ncbi:MAG: Tm-1-like ATP-binding domain-containing protein [Armatimonadota bacterium]|nr:Tm-1-like ATP-binding domain-containing protein [Armatimonadota bacterium]MDR7451830.1 Tm-1-like ATP-binding domain-containing protein [Armatimonadota bacterium]MDR7467555.1 Tm-1-like ATP-binding domain-containing protein [Armatimonadota bacterium]MDR7494484.1 Tm-1-like ATP-binding domain-containing protein [Armatimonadota bacterium]MDR7499745.1 Tm-1-like ATP-binding domain-containing protein [Armatimonadota bacterium]
MGGAAQTPRVVAIVATLDTKEPEATFLAEAVAARGYEPRLLDVSIRGSRASMRRDEAMAAGGAEAARILDGLYRQRALAGVLGIGGNQGTAAAAIAMRDLPIGVPKVLVSTIVSGNLRPYIGASDIVMIPAVGDLLGGTNRLTRAVLAQAAAIMAAMIDSRAAGTVSTATPAVALTALGNVEPAARRIIQALGQSGLEVIPFHASGAGGTAMEALMETGMFAAVADLATHELLGEVVGDDIYAPVRPGRLTVAGRLGIPQVVAPGGLDFLVFGPPDSVPPAYRGRATHRHNPYNTNIRASADELRRAGETMARRLREARGPVAFIDPLEGWSQVGRRGGPLWDASANEAFRIALREGLRDAPVQYIAMEAAINDPPVADQVVQLLRQWLGR